VLAKAKAKKVVLLADASGGSFALAYAAARPDRVSHVVLHGGPWPSGAAVRAMREQMAEAMPEPWRPDAAWAAEQALAGLPLRVALRVLARSLAAAMVNNTELVRRLVIDNLFDDAFDPELAARAVAEAERFPPKVAQAKVLLLLGSAAPWAATTQVEVKQLPAEQGQKVKLVPIAGCRSLPLLENPAQALSAIVDFLD
jgi:pimeloyl-ACP methyl ester carboxylesterase